MSVEQGGVRSLRAEGRLVAPATIYDEIAARLYVSREYVKRTIYYMAYGGEIDPWVGHLFMIEIMEICERELRRG